MDFSGGASMKVTMKKGGGVNGVVQAIPSKSHVHRLLILAALADKQTHIQMPKTDGIDIWATIRCLQAMGADVKQVETGFCVTPIDRENYPKKAVFPVEESGSTLRFLVPVAAALGIESTFEMKGRLPERPMDVLEQELEKKGICFSRNQANCLHMKGKLQAGDFTLPGDISSQYITGLLFALPLLDACSSLAVTGNIESEDYIILSLDCLEAFSCMPKIVGNQYEISADASLISPREVIAEGDWSNAAFWLCAAALSGGKIEMTGLQKQSKQGDRAVLDILSQMGVEISWNAGILQAKAGTLQAVEIDAIPVPDLIPVLSAVAAVGVGTTNVKNAARLRIKESDRLQATAQVLNTLGAKVTELEAGLEIKGVTHLAGGTVDSFHDHRIAMMAGVASLVCTEDVVITNAQAVRKSYPTFWQELSRLGKELVIWEEDK